MEGLWKNERGLGCMDVELVDTVLVVKEGRSPLAAHGKRLQRINPCVAEQVLRGGHLELLAEVVWPALKPSKLDPSSTG